jgi:hypothetical protein
VSGCARAINQHCQIGIATVDELVEPCFDQISHLLFLLVQRRELDRRQWHLAIYGDKEQLVVKIPAV